MTPLRLLQGHTERGLRAYEAAARAAAEAERQRLLKAALQDVPPPRPLSDLQALTLILAAFALGMVAGYWLHSLPVS